jgi:hypothetical protein
MSVSIGAKSKNEAAKIQREKAAKRVVSHFGLPRPPIVFQNSVRKLPGGSVASGPPPGAISLAATNFIGRIHENCSSN